jgi:RNA polymerase sigma-70 factor (ECF subfamily)
MVTVPEIDPAHLSSHQSERALVERAAHGDQSAFTQLYLSHRPIVARYLRGRLPGPDDAQDVEQEVFLLAHRGLPRFQWRDVPVAAWLLTIARRRVAQFWRTRARRPQVPLYEQAHTGEGPEETFERAERRRTALAAVAALPEPQRRAMLLRLRGLSHREVAITLGRSEVNARVLQHRALARLRAEVRGAKEAESATE